MTRQISIIVALLSLVLLSACDDAGKSKPRSAAQSQPASQIPTETRMAWWREARFGMFIHWGLYAIPAGEWNGKTSYGEWIRDEAKIPVGEYEKLLARFNPVKFDAVAWVRLAKAAGMKYIVITSKHHDGFCLFESQYTDWDVMSTPFHRDIMREMADACKKEGMTICWYHSIMDWHHPDYLPRRPWERADRPETGADFERFNTYLKNQVEELLTRYGPIGVMWFDGQWEGTWTHERGVDLYDHVRSLGAWTIINNRVDKGGGQFGMTKSAEYKGDFGTPEQEIPPTGYPGVDWETCMTMNDHWGYNAHDKKFKSTEDLIRKLADIASKGGNFLLNVGPTAEGEIPPESVERLHDIGKWMDINGESIHGTTAGPFRELKWGRCTQRSLAAEDGGGTRLYLHIFDWPADGRLILPGLYNDGRSARILGESEGAKRSVIRENDAVVVSLPGKRPADSPIDTVIALDIDGKPDVSYPPDITAETDTFVKSTEVTVKSDRQGIQLRYTTDGSDPGERSPEVRRPIRLVQTTTVKAQAFRRSRPVSPIAQRTFTKVEPRPAVRTDSTVPGLRFDYYEGDWDKLPDFDKLMPVLSGTAAKFDRHEKKHDDKFAFRYRGVISIPEDGVYRFWTVSDDGSRLWIGDQLVVDNDGLHSMTE